MRRANLRRVIDPCVTVCLLKRLELVSKYPRGLALMGVNVIACKRERSFVSHVVTASHCTLALLLAGYTDAITAPFWGE